MMKELFGLLLDKILRYRFSPELDAIPTQAYETTAFQQSC